MKSENTFIITPENLDQENALKAFLKALKMKFEVTEKPYDPEFVNKIEESRSEYRQGKTTKVAKDNLQKFFGIE